jgi:hypothetical protein
MKESIGSKVAEARADNQNVSEETAHPKGKERPMTFKSMCKAVLAAALVMALHSSPPPLAAEEFQIITTPQLKQWLASPQKPFLVYTLSQVEFHEKRIPGSVCIPTEEIGRTNALPENKNTPLVFYCQGPG